MHGLRRRRIRRSSRSAFGSRSSASSAACRSRSSLPTAWRACDFPARRWSTRSSTCRSCCRRSSSDSRCWCCSAGAARSAACSIEWFGIVLRVSLDRRGAGVGNHGFSADGARDPAVDRARSTGGSKWPRERSAARALWVFASITLPLALPGHHHRHAAVVRARPRRIRRDDHVRVQHSRRDRRRCRSRSIRSPRCPAATPRRCASASSPSSCRSSRSRRPNG